MRKCEEIQNETTEIERDERDSNEDQRKTTKKFKIQLELRKTIMTKVLMRIRKKMRMMSFLRSIMLRTMKWNC